MNVSGSGNSGSPTSLANQPQQNVSPEQSETQRSQADPRPQRLSRLPGPEVLFPGITAATTVIPAQHARENPLHMSPSPGWSRHLSTEAVEDLLTEMNHNGLAHVAWGSKPVFYLEGANEGGSWPHFADAQANGMKHGFALIPSANNRSASPDDHEGYLINISNALRAINGNKQLFSERFNLPAATDAGFILQHHVFPMLEQKTHNDEPEITAVLLGFGHENAHAFNDINSGNSAQRQSVRQQNQSLNDYVSSRLDAMSAQNTRGLQAPAIPSFIKFDSPATRASLDNYITESSRIQDAQTDLIDRHEDPNVMDDNENDEALEEEQRIMASALMRRLCQEPA